MDLSHRLSVRGSLSIVDGSLMVPPAWLQVHHVGMESAAVSHITGKMPTTHSSANGVPLPCLSLDPFGQDMARVESVIVLAGICARFDLALAPGQVRPSSGLLVVAALAAAVPGQTTVLLAGIARPVDRRRILHTPLGSRSPLSLTVPRERSRTR